MKLETRHYVGIGVGIAILIGNILLFRQSKIFYFLAGIAFLVAALPFIASVVIEAGREKEKEEMFLEFSRNLAESVKAGTPISKSIINVRGGKYGSLSPHIDKLANQIALGIPVRQALGVFARDTGNKVIARSAVLITEAEESGGKIDEVLENVAKSVSEVEDIKKERKSSMFNTIVQLYIIFLIFLVIMLVVQIKFIPTLLETIIATGGMGGLAEGGVFGMGGQAETQAIMNQLFLILMIVQGFFAGFVIGKLSEGSIKYGIKHSAIITAIAYLVTTGIRAFMTPAAAT